MAHTGGSSLLGQSVVPNTANTRFDVRDEQGVLLLLQAIHRSPLEQDIKNKLRNALFVHRQSGDTNMQELAHLFSQHGFTLSADSEPPRTATTSLGHRRVAPQFSATQQQAPAAPAPKQQVTPSPQVAATPQQTPPPPVQHDVQMSTSSTYADPDERIKLIKREVNQKVGNPVSLIAANNEIGKEYMAALLDAMKAAHGGSSSGINVAMERLEKAFAQVQALDMSATSAPKQESKEAYSVPHSEEVATEEKEDAAPEAQTKTTHIPNHSSASTEEPEELLDQQQPESASHTAPAKTKSALNILFAADEPSDTPAVPKETPAPAPPKPEAPKEQQPVAWGEKRESAAPVQGITSVAKEKQLQELMRNNRSKAVEQQKREEEAKLASMDPLMVPRVTAGLQQLLSEWSLFKSSGFLGTGPSGIDHPLYKKLRGLTMAAVIAGRFEGATPAIKQSITDYMNGWRYEEEVIHEHTETFEHYLRRVVRHVLNRRENT